MVVHTIFASGFTQTETASSYSLSLNWTTTSQSQIHTSMPCFMIQGLILGPRCDLKNQKKSLIVVPRLRKSFPCHEKLKVFQKEDVIRLKAQGQSGVQHTQEEGLKDEQQRQRKKEESFSADEFFVQASIDNETSAGNHKNLMDNEFEGVMDNHDGADGSNKENEDRNSFSAFLAQHHEEFSSLYRDYRVALQQSVLHHEKMIDDRLDTKQKHVLVNVAPRRKMKDSHLENKGDTEGEVDKIGGPNATHFIQFPDDRLRVAAYLKAARDHSDSVQVTQVDQARKYTAGISRQLNETQREKTIHRVVVCVSSPYLLDQIENDIIPSIFNNMAQIDQICNNTANLMDEKSSNSHIHPKEFCVFRGRDHYMSKRRLGMTLTRSHHIFDKVTEIPFMQSLVDWSKTTIDGSWNDVLESNLNGTEAALMKDSSRLTTSGISGGNVGGIYASAEAKMAAEKVWQYVKSNEGNCRKEACPYFENCFYFTKQRTLDEARVIVIPTSLLFSQSELEMSKLEAKAELELMIEMQKSEPDPDKVPNPISDTSILPKFHSIIFDNAGSLPTYMAGHFGSSFSADSIRHLLLTMYNKKSKLGFLTAHGIEAKGQAAGVIRECRKFFQAMELKMFRWSIKRFQEPELYRTTNYENKISRILLSLVKPIRRAKKTCGSESAELNLQHAIEQIRHYAFKIDDWLSQAQSDHVYWVERYSLDSRESKRPITPLLFHAVPYNMSLVFQKHVSSKNTSIVLTGAMLGSSVDSRDPSFLCYSLNIQNPLFSASSRSAFTGKPIKVIALTDLPDPVLSEPLYILSIEDVIKAYSLQLCKESKMIVIFPYNEMIDIVAGRFYDWARRHEVRFLRQMSLGPDRRLNDAFLSKARGVFFATESYWLQSELPADCVQHIIYVKFPYATPDHPLERCKMEAVDFAGKDVFEDYQLPEACFRLNQTLLRVSPNTRLSSHFIFTDPRVANKNFGRLLLNHLPEADIEMRCFFEKKTERKKQGKEDPDERARNKRMKGMMRMLKIEEEQEKEAIEEHYLGLQGRDKDGQSYATRAFI